jgi:hypothetical protein
VSFKPGDKVVRKTGGAPFIVHIVTDIYNPPDKGSRPTNEPSVLDVHLNWVKQKDCVHWDIYNSPLYKAMQEN